MNNQMQIIEERAIQKIREHIDDAILHVSNSKTLTMEQKRHVSQDLIKAKKDLETKP